MGEAHARLRRLDALALALREQEGILGLVGVGSAGTETDRFDEHSDTDVFVPADDRTRRRYVDDPTRLGAEGASGGPERATALSPSSA